MENNTYTVFVAIVGRPNVGKSTLLNRILGHKVSITSRKPQTTREQIIGIKTQDTMQTIYVDTPGLQSILPKALNRYMNRAALTALYDVDVVVLMVDARVWTADDEQVLQKLRHISAPVILVLNKIDRLADKKHLLPLLEKLSSKHAFAAIIPLSAKHGTSIEQLEKQIQCYARQAPFYYAADQITNRDQRAQLADIIREKLIRHLGQELPYVTAVEIDYCQMDNQRASTAGHSGAESDAVVADQTISSPKDRSILNVSAIIWVEREGQKAIVIGKQGLHLKRIAADARMDMERRFETKVFLKVWVKCKDNWTDNENWLKQLGLGH